MHEFPDFAHAFLPAIFTGLVGYSPDSMPRKQVERLMGSRLIFVILHPHDVFQCVES